MAYMEGAYGDEGRAITSNARTEAIIQDLKLQIASYRMRDLVEAKLRKDNVAVQDAWDKYQTVLTLARTDK